MTAFGASHAIAAEGDIAPAGTLRAVFLMTNPAQAVRDAASGETRGASADLARELAKRRNLGVTPAGSRTPSLPD
jgi:ABC-type amino acid transport substrate-binding protein